MRLSMAPLLGLAVGSSLVMWNEFNPQMGSHSARGLPAAEDKKGVFFMNRIGPSTSELYLANADGANERKLFGSNSSTFDYHASFSLDANGTGLEPLLTSSSFEDAGVLSPDGTKLAYVSTASGYFRPAWSPDGEQLAFASDRNTQWTGHDNGTGWEHTQQLSIYIIRPNGSDFRQIATKDDYSLGSPNLASRCAQIISVDIATGLDRIEHTSGLGVKMFPQYVTDTVIGFMVKGSDEGVNYTSYGTNFTAQFLRSVRSPSWSPDGKTVIYEKVGWDIRPQEKQIYSWDREWEYRFTDVFPMLSRQGKMAITQKQLGNSSIVTMNPDGSNLFTVFDTLSAGEIDPPLVSKGLAGAFQPTWSPDGRWIAFGLGQWFQVRATGHAKIYRAKSGGSFYQNLTGGTVHSGFPSYSADGRYIVFREWGGPYGLKLIDLRTNTTRYLTNSTDNLPGWSPDGERIVFTRKMNATNFDICTIRPDGTDLQVLTSSGANDAHAVWTGGGRIAYSSGMYGFRDECAIYDNAFQLYGQIIVMNAEGSNKTMLTDSMWEDSMPLYVPNEFLI
ncbi:hypothetical protein DL767_005189 [Monosporascus sp. MG133]|nr:hypothetical protein DL767_005189 [Monosporascus sp. MG133]